MIIKYKKLTPDAKIPSYAHPGDAGMDIYSNEDYILKPGEKHIFKTGIASEFSNGYVALVWDKGGFGAKGIHRFAGVIDAGYRGEWMIILNNFSSEVYPIEKGDKIAQALIQKIEYAEILEAENLDSSLRGEGKFGSTGRK